MRRRVLGLPKRNLFLSLTLGALMIAGAACGGGAAAPASGGSGASSPSAAAGSPAGSVPGNAEVQKLYQAAKAEGSFEAWTSWDSDQFAGVYGVFKQAYPGIAGKSFQIRIEDALSRITTEMSSTGHTTADTIESNLPAAQLLVDRKIVEPFDWSTLGTPKERVFGDNWGVGVFHNTNPLAYNTDMLKPGDLPKSWQELGDPKWKGKLIIEYRAFPIIGLWPQLGEDGAVDLVTKIVKGNNAIVIQGQTTVLQAGIAGQAPIMIGPPHYRIPQEAAKGAPVAFVPGLPASVRTVGTTVGKGMHPNAAKLWAWWLGTDQGQAAVVKYQGAGLITDASDNQAAQAIKKANISLLFLDAQQELKLGDLSKRIEPILHG